MAKYNVSRRANKRAFKRNAAKVHVKNLSGHSLMRGGERL